MLGGKFHSFDSCGKILGDFLKERKVCEPILTDDRNVFKNLKDYDLVIVYTQGGELTSAQEEGLCEFVKKGGGFIGIHCASDSWVKNKAYMEMLGSHFIGHGHVTEFLVKISQGDHNITRRISDFEVTDEFYMLKKKTEKFEVLATGIWQAKEHPLAYVRHYGKGKVFYTALGHDERIFKNPFFQKLIFRGTRWVTNQKERKEVRCGVIGYGGAFGMGKYHGDFISKTPGLKLTAICDVDEKRLEVAQKDYPGIKIYSKIEKMLSVFHKRLWYDVTNKDQCQAIVRFEGGRYAEFQTSAIAAIGKPKWRILGTKGALSINHGEEDIRVISFIHGSREELKVPFMQSSSWDNYYINIADHLSTGEPLAVTADSARRVIAVFELAEKSAKSGKVQPVPYEK